MWILIDKQYYDSVAKTILEFKPGNVVDPNGMYWYNTVTEEKLPGNIIPSLGKVNGVQISNQLGAAYNISENAIPVWFDSNKKLVFENIISQFNLTFNNKLNEFFAFANKYNINTSGLGEEGSEFQTREEIKLKIIEDFVNKYLNNAWENKDLIGIYNIQQEPITEEFIQEFNASEEETVEEIEEEIEEEPEEEIEEETETTTGFPKTYYNADGEESIVNNPTEEYYAKQGGYNLTEKPTVEVVEEESVPPGKSWNAIGQLGITGQSNDGYEYKFYDRPGYGNNPGVTNIGDPDPEPVEDQGKFGEDTGSGEQVNTETIEFNNIPNEGLLWDVEGSLYIVYEVPGANGEVYEGSPVYMAYEVIDNDIYKAGLLTEGETAPQPNAIVDKTFFNNTSVVAGNTNQLSALIDNPFASFVETITEQSQVAPWITDPEMIALLAEAAIEDRTVTDAEWQTTNWYQTHNQTERDWLRTYYSDPSTATQLTTDSQISVANSLQAAGVSNAPEALINWVAGKFVSGEWSQTYTTEQISLFADPYATGKRDESFENYLSSTALTGVDRTTERENEVRELYIKWLGPTLGKLTDQEAAEIAGRLRDDPDYQDQLVQSLKQSRLAAFSAYTNPELTYEDIARPWRNLTTSVWGQTADETQGWWQEMVKSNDFAQAQNTLREKGLEQDITQVTTDATQALQQALGQGTVSQSGVNV